MGKVIKKIKLYIIAYKVISVIVLIAVLGAGYWGYKKITNTAGTPRYITAKISKGVIVSSISGSGQVGSFNQIDVKAKASGDVVYIAVKDGQKIGTGGLIAQLDDKNAKKAVRDAEINLESAEISLGKLKLQDSSENLNADLAKAYDDGFNNISNVFLDLPGIMAGLNDMFFKSSVGTQQQWNIDWYEGQVTGDNHDEILVLKQNLVDSFDKAKNSYDASLDSYKKVSRISDNATIEKLISQTYESTKLISDVTKNANNYIDFVDSSLQKNNVSTPSLIIAHKTTLNSYTSKTNTFLLNLQTTTMSIKSYKDAFPNSNLDIQSAELSLKQKGNTLNDAKEQLADYFIRAPFSGTIAAVNIKKGDSVSASTIAATLITERQLAEISLNEVYVAKIKIGQKTALTFDAVPDLRISGLVADIDAVGTVSQGVVTYIVKISFDAQDDRIKPGMSVSAEIITDEKQDILVIPNSAIKSLPANSGAGQVGKNYVEMLTESSVIPSKIFVEVGLENDSRSEIISGIKEGDEIIVRTILPSAGAPAASAPSIFGGTGGARTTSGGAVRFQAR